MLSEETASEHLEEEEVAAYLDHALSPAERARVEAHLADCSLCRREVVEVSRLVDSAPRREPRRVFAPAAVAAAVAAAAAGLLLWSPAAEFSPSPGEVVRTEQPAAVEGVATIPVVSPDESAPIAREDLAFSWRSAGEDALYRLTLSDEEGSVHWTGTTSDTTVVLPPQVELQPGRLYFWHVDALLPDGRTATTRVRRFTLLP